MHKTMAATFDNGVIRPDSELHLSPGTRVWITLQVLGEDSAEKQREWDEFDRLSEEISVDSGGVRMSRDQLHERR